MTEENTIDEPNDIKPTAKERKALSLFFDRFYNLYDEILAEKFFDRKAEYRFGKIKEAFSIYKEMTEYEPIKYYLFWMKQGGRPIFDGIISDELFSFIRNLLAHYPLFDKWDDVFIDRDLATWSRTGSIDKFLKNCAKITIDGEPTVKYRIWEYETKKMTYFSVNFPRTYQEGKRIYLKNILEEEVGIKFCVSMMKKVIDIAIENPPPAKIDVMSQVYIPIPREKH